MSTAQQTADLYKAAIEARLTGGTVQEWSADGVNMKKASLTELEAGYKKWSQVARAESSNRLSIIQGVREALA